MGLPVHEERFCTDCWASWQNIRQNLDGTNEHGIQGMTCPHCQKPLTDQDTTYVKVPPHLYEVTVDGHPFLVTVDTKTANFRQSIWWSTAVATPYEGHDMFDVAVDDIVLTGLYLCLEAGSCVQVVPRKRTRVLVQLYPSMSILFFDVYDTSTFDALKQLLIQKGYCDPVLFTALTGIEYVGSRTIGSYPNLDIIAVMPQNLYNSIRQTLYAVDMFVVVAVQ